MKMNRRAVKFYKLAVTTEPEVTSWEASFDRGLTFFPGTLLDGEWYWLLAGPDATEEDASPATTRIARGGIPIIHAIGSAPEVLYEAAPRITLFR